MSNLYRYTKRYNSNKNERFKINKSNLLKHFILSLIIFLFMFISTNGYRPYNMVVKTYSNKILSTDTNLNEIKNNIENLWGKLVQENGDKNVDETQSTAN